MSVAPRSRMDRSAALVYRRRASPLHAAAAPVVAAYGAAIAVAALLIEHPLQLGALLLTVLGAAAGAGVAAPLLRAGLRTAAPLLIVTVLINALVNRQGLTVFARLGDWGVLGQVNLTVEAVVYGLVFALRLLVVMLACLLVVCAADPDMMLLACRRISPRSALTAALATRLVPVLGQDARRLAEAQRCRPGDGELGIRERLLILRATVAGALDRSLDVAAVLEMRGYGAPAAARPAGPAWRLRSRHDIAFMLAAAATLALGVLAAISQHGAFHSFPLVHAAVTPGVIAIAIALPCVAWAPFADRRGIDQ
jgi:energy-coupling factor transport system permease protein